MGKNWLKIYSILAVLFLGHVQPTLAQDSDWGTIYETSVTLDLDISDLTEDVTYVTVGCSFFSAFIGENGILDDIVGRGYAVIFDSSFQSANELIARVDLNQMLGKTNFYPVEGFSAFGVNQQIKVDIYAEDEFERWGRGSCKLAIMTSDLLHLSEDDLLSSWSYPAISCESEIPKNFADQCVAPGTSRQESEYSFVRKFGGNEAAPTPDGGEGG